MKTYSELIRLPTFEERFRYLALNGSVGEDTFGFDRYFNQQLYKSNEWRHIRREVILRDNGCDLGIPDRVIFGKIIIHHMNPITLVDLENNNPDIFDPEFLITTTKKTHDAIHYGNESFLDDYIFNEREPNDTCPWK